jgi:hypothetical protein
VSERRVLIGAHLHRADAELADLELFPAGPLVLSAARFDPAAGLGDREVIGRVSRLRRELIEREIFVAIRYGATVSSPTEAAAKCAPHLERWRELLEKHRGRVEMTLKVLAGGRVERPHRSDHHTGTSYLQALQRARDLARPDSRFVEEVEAAFGPMAAEWRWSPGREGAVEYAFLLAREFQPEAARKAMELKERFSETPFLLSGPWPLETFADE